MVRIQLFTAVLLLIFIQSFGQSRSSKDGQWLVEHTRLFPGKDSLTDSSPLATLLDGKSVVAVGEVTHGTKQVEQLQLAVAKSLVQKRGYTAVALGELYISTTWLLNDYVVSGSGNVKRALGEAFRYQYGGYSNDLLQFVDWVRAINANRPPEQRVWLLGTETGPPPTLARIAWEYTQQQPLTMPDSMRSTLADLLTLPFTYKAQPNVDQLLTDTRRLVAYLINQPTPPGLTDKQQWQLQCIRQLPASLETFARPTQIRRDRAIFDNIRWLKERRPDTKLVVIAIHNAHVEKQPCYHWEGLTRAGYWLDSTYRQQFVAIATEVGQGTFGSGNDKKFATVQVPGNRRKLGSLLHRLTDAPYALITLNASAATTQFFRTHNRLTYGTSDQRVGMTWACRQLPDAFDALLYSRKSDPVQRNLTPDDSPAAPTFGLYLTLPDTLSQQLRSATQFRLGLQTTFTGNDSTAGLVRLSVYCHSRRKKQLMHRIVLVNSGTTLDQRFDIPRRTHFISIGLFADQTTTLAVQQLRLNDQLLPVTTLSFHDWQPAGTSQKGPYQVDYRADKVRVQRR